MKFLDLTNRRFGRLVAQWPAGRTQSLIQWLCSCDCGNLPIVYGGNLRRGLSRSCGCVKRVHGEASNRRESAEYRTWVGLKGRCLNPKNKDYCRYGLRGIKVSHRWLGPSGFANFLKDMGRKPSTRHSIDRINNDGNYEPGNCRWATDEQQRANKRLHNRRNRFGQFVRKEL